MGMFSKLFGGAGSDKADKLRAQALEAFTSIQTPQLKDLQIQLDKYVQAGRMTPEQAEAQMLGSSAFNDIVTDPSFVGAQKQALQQMQNVATEGGLTAIDKAKLNDITIQQNQQNKSQNAATMQQAQQRGMGGSDINTVNQLINEQGAADRASNAGLNVAAQAQARALQAMQAAGQQGGAMQAQQYGEQAEKAKAANAIDVFNKQTLNQTNLYNTQSANEAQAANLAETQRVSDANVGAGNANLKYNAQQNQAVFDNAMAKAGGVANVAQKSADAADAASAAERNASAGLISGAAQMGGTALAGPLGGMIAGGMTRGPADAAARPDTRMGSTNSNYRRNKDGSYNFAEGGEVCMNEGGEAKTPPLPIKSNGKGWTLSDPNGEVVGDFPSYSDAVDFAQKVEQKQPHVKDFKDGGPVPGQAQVAGDSPKNDTVDAKLSPGEVVVPRSAMDDDKEFEQFMERFRPSKRDKKPDSDKPLMAQALENLHARLRKIEGQ